RRAARFSRRVLRDHRRHASRSGDRDSRRGTSRRAMSEEIVDGFAWTPELRSRVYPSRKLPNPGFLDGLLERVSLKHPIDAKAARDGAAYYWKESKRPAGWAKTGLAKNPSAWIPAVEAALARHKNPKADHALDTDVEAAAVTLE